MQKQRSQKISTFGSRLTSIVSVSLVLILLGVAAMLAIVAHNISRDIRGSVGFTIRMEREASPESIDAVRHLLSADRGVNSSHYLSPDSILAAETAAMGGSLALEPGVNPYCAEFEVKVKPEYAVADSIAAISEVYGSMTGVEEVIAETAVITAVERTMAKTRIILLVLAAGLLLISVALINNTVSLSIYSRRFNIHTMRLVGATAGFIRRPFVMQGALNGLFAGVIAVAVLLGLRAYAGGLDPAVDNTLPWTALAMVAAAVIVAGVLLCTCTSYFATNRYLAKSYDEMFLK